MLRYFRKKKSYKPNFERYGGKSYVMPMKWPFATWLRVLLSPWAGRTFFDSIISMLACMAHADGPVTERELRVFMEVLEKEFNLLPDEIEKAREVLFKNKNRKKTFNQYAEQFYRFFKRSPATLENALDVLLAMAYEDNHLTLGEQELITHAAQIFHIGGKELDRLVKRYHKNITTVEKPLDRPQEQKKQQQFKFKEEEKSEKKFEHKQEYKQEHKKEEKWSKSEHVATNNWWIVLELSPTAKEDEVKKQYRILVKRYHPDRQPIGVPEEMKRASTKRFMEIQKAYDQFCIELSRQHSY